MSALLTQTVTDWVVGLGVGGVLIAISRKRVLLQRWFVWLVLFSIFGAATWLAESTGNHLALWLLAIAVGMRMLGEYRRMFSVRAMLNPLVLIWLIGLPLIWATTKPADFFALFLLVAAFDIGGWVGGNTRFINRGVLARKLAPNISPNKTYAGLLGSVVLIAAVSFSLSPAFLDPLRLAAVCVLAVAGDLIESAVKRRAGVKDAGRILPGFGGLLDRFDSLLLAGLVLVTLT